MEKTKKELQTIRKRKHGKCEEVPVKKAWGSVAGAWLVPGVLGRSIVPHVTILPYHHTIPNLTIPPYCHTTPRLTIMSYHNIPYLSLPYCYLTLLYLTKPCILLLVSIVLHLTYFPSAIPPCVCLSLFTLGHKPEGKRWSIKSQPAQAVACRNQAFLALIMLSISAMSVKGEVKERYRKQSCMLIFYVCFRPIYQKIFHKTTTILQWFNIRLCPSDSDDLSK